MMKALLRFNFKSAGGNQCPSDQRPYRNLFILTGALLLIILPVLSFDFGITWDEWMQSHYGRLVLRFLLSGGQNHDFMNFAETAYLYGGFFDTITGLVYATLFDNVHHFVYAAIGDTLKGISGQDLFGSGYYETRHVINSLFGFAAILFTGLLTQKLSSWRGACLALLFMALSPVFIGHSMNNPKDIPFAATYVFTFYFFIVYLRQLPKPKISTMVCISLGIAAAIGIRVGGIILIFYLILFSGAAWVRSVLNQSAGWNPWMLGGRVAAISLGGYVGGLIFWPYGCMNPVKNLFATLKAFSRFSEATISNVLFEGKMIAINNLPWHYIPKWIWISSPLVVLAGLILFPILIREIYRKTHYKAVLLVLFALLFPILSVIIQKPILYDSWRHLLFVYPPLVAIAAVSWEIFLRLTGNRIFKALSIALLVLLGIEPLCWMIRNHPNEYVYFNPLAGGINRAYVNYQTDYWGNSIRQAALWLANDHRQKAPGQVILIDSNGSIMSSFSYLRKVLGPEYIPYRQIPAPLRLTNPPHYKILLPRNLSKEDFLGGQWPPPGTIYEVKADHATLCAVAKSPNVPTKP
ncbi:MAG: hypothetical protein PHN49_11335 [Candidatus Omnitrophica bacterium]|nr:hypothetical protein [Candidatus Omnitrophota bacterium]